MNRIRGGATALLVALLIPAGIARAQEIAGRLTGRVTDQDTGVPLGGVTVIVQGPQGEDATLTDDRGEYHFTALPVGTYVIRFYVANASTQVEQAGVVVEAGRLVRVNARIAGTVQAAAQQTYVITGRPPTVDVGNARVGNTYEETYTRNLPLDRTYGDVIARAPGSFVDPSGNVSIGGSTGLENIYVVNGLNVTGIEYGNLEAGTPSTGGGTNLPIEFLTQIDVSRGGYQAEFGGAMGGVINSVLKSGSNEFHGSVFSYWSPYWLSGDPRSITTVGRSLGYTRMPDFDTSIGAEVSGPLIKDKLFFWAGFAPRFQNSHVFRQTYLTLEDHTNGGALVDAEGRPIQIENTYWRARIPESRKTYYYGATVDFTPRPEHRLTVALLGSPNFNNQMRSFNNQEFISNPAWAQEALTKVNTDLSARWTSRLFNNKWQIEAMAGLHSEYYNNRSPNALLNSQNQLTYWGTNLWDMERAPGCEPNPATGFSPCPLDFYRTGGFGLVKKYTGYRYVGEVKSTHLFEAGGRHEAKYGWLLQYATFDQDRSYTGPDGSRALVDLFPNGGGTAGYPNFNTWSLFTLGQGEFPSTYGDPRLAAFGMYDPTWQKPLTNLLYGPQYQDTLSAKVKSVSNAFFLQDSFSPNGLRNLTVNAGVRLELQKMYDFQGSAFLDTRNWGPRVGVVYDPFNDGRSKVSASYGRYFEAIPLNLAGRYFGGEGIFLRNGVPFASCANPDPYGWQTSGTEFRSCNLPARDDQTGANDLSTGGQLYNNGRPYPVQANLAGQYHNEIVATAEREIFEDTTVRLDYLHRWLGTIIEDGAGPTLTFALANPGHVPDSALSAARQDVEDATATLEQANTALAGMPNDPTLKAAVANANAELGNAQATLATLQQLDTAPKPTRTYDALTVSLNRRFSKNWLTRASYTYSRLVGNYQGLFQAEQLYFAPNGSNAYDTADLYHNMYGPLPNDRPHHAHVDGFYTHQIGKGEFVAGLSFSARSGMPRNYVGALIPNQQLIMLLPRGSAGRTDAITEVNGRLAYRRQLSPKVNLEAFIDFFNIFNQQAPLLTDDNYTYDMAAPIVNGRPEDLKFAKNLFGGPLTTNPNYGRALLYQAPFRGRLGLRLTF